MHINYSTSHFHNNIAILLAGFAQNILHIA